MSWLEFNDGEKFDTSGPMRKEHRHDGWYVIGMGCLIPMKNESDADEYIKRHTLEDLDHFGPNRGSGV